MTEAPIIKKPLQWTSFYMIETSLMKEFQEHLSEEIQIT